MTFSDDYASTFSGDETGDIFDAPDVVRQSPTTTERVVDTQSGFLVVIKRIDTRFSLSVKRRLGTPPVSSILLTPDESIKLSKILGSARSETRSGRINAPISPDVDGWLAGIEDLDRETADSEDSEEVEPGQVRDPHSRSYTAKRPRSTRRRNATPIKLPLKMIGIVAACLILLPVMAFGGYKVLTAKHAPKAAAVVTPAVDVEAIEAERVNKFSRTFVSEMLDLSPSTYRVSQVHAMANMSPELLESYWTETHFPLTTEQLKASPQGMTLMITKVDQQRIDELSRLVDIFAELVSPNSKLSNAVHLQLKVATASDGQLRVLEQKDLSAKK
ncbi:MAG: hypothetical protein HYX67_06975 [Candidatus Melainabacteria bacterium]|nr:hypothetical protein [Candidatus Melainabacteria bacterium]